jgi:hypothetical protein
MYIPLSPEVEYSNRTFNLVLSVISAVYLICKRLNTLQRKPGLFGDRGDTAVQAPTFNSGGLGQRIWSLFTSVSLSNCFYDHMDMHVKH